MQLHLAPVLSTPGETLDFSFALANDDLPFACPALVTGQAANHAGIATLSGTADVRLSTQCDRCAQPMEYQAEVEFSHTLVTSRAGEENDELVLVEDMRFDPTHLVWEDIVLAMPPKMLCKPGCEGLCSRCGKNLNEGPCGCKPAVDPRWEALQSLLPSAP